ncbi:O-antigen polymerase [Flavobacterium saccharophilum]|uniref:Oligosaccharide repeat unit polymerase n=1 Tax=Flavobacterium saccharophilum TaxID=29534 RepID=A0A1M7K9U3_9FLAO|nr:O-antigen polymerase [Flavobacterium saccharophilum]SHM62008.1 oligosaccharide repeat unit polymerase [Flavobacterium saccharophilum]
MSVFLGLFFILLAVIFYILTKKYSDPMVVVTASWGATLLLYGTVDHGMPSLSFHVCLIIFLWVISLLLGVSLFNYHKIKKNKVLEKNLFFSDFNNIEDNQVLRRNLNVYFWISVICFFPQVYISYKQAISGGENIFLNMRLASAGLIESEYNVGVFGYGKTFTIVALLVNLLIHKVGQSKIKIYLLFFMYFVLSILAVGKSQFLFLIIAMILVWSFTKTISKRTIIIGFAFLLITFSMLQLARSNEEDDQNDVISGMFYSYLFGGLPALDQVVNSEMQSSEFGQNSFQFVYRFTKAFEENKAKTENTYNNDITYDGYLFVPNPTNVYTIIGPFWLDFRYIGVLIFGFIYGVLFGFLYMKAIQMNIYGIITYCLFVSSLVLPFFGEFIFAYLSYFIQVWFLSYFVDKPFFNNIYSLFNLNKNYS